MSKLQVKPCDTCRFKPWEVGRLTKECKGCYMGNRHQIIKKIKSKKRIVINAKGVD